MTSGDIPSAFDVIIIETGAGTECCWVQLPQHPSGAAGSVSMIGVHSGSPEMPVASPWC
jgi:hypothetical protein